MDLPYAVSHLYNALTSRIEEHEPLSKRVGGDPNK
jgi:hypothetical protein